MSDIQTIIKLKTRINNAKTEREKAIGRREQMLKTLFSKYKCRTVESGEKKLKVLRTKLRGLSDEISQGVKLLKEKYDV
jgi:hypothetical protein